MRAADLVVGLCLLVLLCFGGVAALVAVVMRPSEREARHRRTP